jgi:hypothetical protein
LHPETSQIHLSYCGILTLPPEMLGFDPTIVSCNQAIPSNEEFIKASQAATQKKMGYKDE